MIKRPQEITNLSKTSKKQSMSTLRLQRDIQQYKQHSLDYVKLKFPEEGILSKIIIQIFPENQSIYRNCRVSFELNFPQTYPMEGPKIRCKQKICHPNINLTGAVCLPLVREDWQPTVTLFSIVCGLIYILNNPDGQDALNVEAGKIMKQDKDLFEKVVKHTNNGGTLQNITYDSIVCQKI